MYMHTCRRGPGLLLFAMRVVMLTSALSIAVLLMYIGTERRAGQRHMLLLAILPVLDVLVASPRRWLPALVIATSVDQMRRRGTYTYAYEVWVIYVYICTCHRHIRRPDEEARCMHAHVHVHAHVHARRPDEEKLHAMAVLTYLLTYLPKVPSGRRCTRWRRRRRCVCSRRSTRCSRTPAGCSSCSSYNSHNSQRLR